MRPVIISRIIENIPLGQLLPKLRTWNYNPLQFRETPFSSYFVFTCELLLFFFFKAEKSNIRLDDVPPLASIDTILKTQESVQDVIVKEESIGQAKAEEQLSNEQADTYQRQMGDKFCAMVVRTTLLESLSM